MEQVTDFLTNNALLVETVLSVIILVLGNIAWKFRHAAIAAAEALKDGKIDRAEVENIVDKLLDAVYVAKPAAPKEEGAE